MSRKIEDPVKNSEFENHENDLHKKEKDFHSSLSEYLYRNRAINVNDAFINSCRHDGSNVLVKMVDGSEEIGSIIAFDSTSIILENIETKSQTMLMKCFIMKLTPNKATYYVKRGFKRIVKDDGQIIYDYSGCLL